MRFPEVLYRGGALVRELSLLNESLNQSGVASGQTLDITNTNINYAWILTNLYIDAIPAGAEFITRLRLIVATPSEDTSGVEYMLRGDGTSGAAAAFRSLDWQGEALVLPSWRVRALVNKSAGVGNVDCRLRVYGYQIPSGNFVR